MQRGLAKAPKILAPTMLALATLAIAAAPQTVAAQSAAQCSTFPAMRDDAQKKALAVRTAMEHKADRKEICALVTRFYAAEGLVVKFFLENKTWCAIPEEAIKAAKANHEHTEKFKTAACAEAPAAKPKMPTLSDAIATPSVATSGNTKTGRGTLDSLNGNPLAK
jgi:hypothetical protein